MIDVDKDALLRAMCDKLPALDQPFTLGDQERWLDAMRAILAFLYPPEWSQEARRLSRHRQGGHVESPLSSELDRDVRPVKRRVVMDDTGGHDDGEDVEPGDVWGFDTPGSEPTGIAGGAPDLNPEDRARDEDDKVAGSGRTGRLENLQPAAEKVGYNQELAPGSLAAGVSEVIHCSEGRPPDEEAPSTTFAGVVDDASGGEEARTGGAEPAGDTSSPAPLEVSPYGSEPTKPSTDDPAPAKSDKRSSPRYFTADQKGAIIKRAVREGTAAVADDLLVHQATINRWMREMPVATRTFTEEWVREQAEALGGPTVEQMEAERNTPIPERTPVPQRDKPAVQWPTTPIERRPVDPDRIRRDQAGQS